MKKDLFACQECGRFYTVKGDVLRHTCDDCGAVLQIAPVNFEEWQVLPDEDRE